MSTTVSRTWRQRLRRARRAGRAAGLAVVAACAVFGFAAAVKVFFLAAHPDEADVAATAHRIDNQRDAAGQFATIDFTFPLTVENSGGTWMIADIDFIPRLASTSDPVPAATHG